MTHPVSFRAHQGKSVYMICSWVYRSARIPVSKLERWFLYEL